EHRRVDSLFWTRISPSTDASQSPPRYSATFPAQRSASRLFAFCPPTLSYGPSFRGVQEDAKHERAFVRIIFSALPMVESDHTLFKRGRRALALRVI
ncbi:hypothetical protein U1Q18_050436, partial [Sarracenia purpurea var. burkii]